MRIISVPEDETYQSPSIEIKDPDMDKAASIMISDDCVWQMIINNVLGVSS